MDLSIWSRPQWGDRTQNTIKRFDGASLAVKQYGHVSPLNKDRYDSTLCRSKTERTCLHAAKLRNLGAALRRHACCFISCIRIMARYGVD